MPASMPAIASARRRRAAATILFCRYHGWDYAIDGRLTDPMLRPEENDRSRFRLPRYAMQIATG